MVVDTQIGSSSLPGSLPVFQDEANTQRKDHSNVCVPNCVTVLYSQASLHAARCIDMFLSLTENIAGIAQYIAFMTMYKIVLCIHKHL